MKKYLKIILVVVTLLLAFVGYYGYQIYKMVMGSEPLGKQEGLPTSMTSMPAITKGNADWPNWRGVNYDGKSAVVGINTDWSKGLEKLWQVNYLCQDKATASWSAPVVQGNRLIVPGRDANNDMFLYQC